MDPNYHLDELDETGNAWETMLRRMLAGAPGDRVLDVGSGSGFLSILLGQMGYRVTGLDSYPLMVRMGRGTAEQYGLSDRVDFQEGDAAWMVIPTDTYDIVVSRYSSFLFRTPEECLRECRRVLKPGGIFLNFDMNWLAPVLSPEAGERFRQDDRAYTEKFGPCHDMYHNDQVLEQMKTLPLAAADRPGWDVEFLKEIGYSEVSAEFHPDAGLWNEKAALRYRSIPTFSVRAVK